MKRQHAVIHIILLVFFGSVVTRGQDATKPELPPHLSQILAWLPTDAETLIVANGPFEFPTKRRTTQPFTDTIRSLSCGLVTQLEQALLAEQLGGKNVLIAVEASRRFTSPQGIGMMPFEGCQLLKFDASGHDAIHAAMEFCFERADKTVQLGDMKVAAFTERWESDEWSLFVAQPQPGVLLCATSQRFLEQVIERMNRDNVGRAFPDSLPEWQQVYFNSSVWGMRHYRTEFADTDPSSPLRSQASASVPDSRAVGFVFWFDAKADKTATAVYLSGANDATKIVSEAWHHPREKLTPEIHEIEPGVVEVKAAVGEDDDGRHMFLFVLLGCLGHAVYL